MNMRELTIALSKILDDFQVDTDNNDQVVIYTGLVKNDDGKLEPMEYN